MRVQKDLGSKKEGRSNAFKTHPGQRHSKFHNKSLHPLRPRAAELLWATEQLMDGSEPLWTRETVWAHEKTDVLEAVGPSSWPEMDSERLSLEDAWRLRVASAQVFSIVKNREVEHFESVMDFLETTYRLLPGLVASIKHMKIMFGLKTMAIMWRLRERRGAVDTVLKINQFFPSKLPQYQDKCSQHEMFIMRKTNLDFRALAQRLAMDKDKLEHYITNDMEMQYGEHYAQKVEDRLVCYLHQLDTVLPGDTSINKLLKKKDPVTEEEKLLLEVITSDSTTTATAIKELLLPDVASCSPASVSQSSERGTNGTKNSQLIKYGLQASSSKAPLVAADTKTPLESQPNVHKGGAEDVSKNSPLLLESDNDSVVGMHQQTEEAGEVANRGEEESSGSVWESTSSPQFCYKHQRWVKSILQQCPEESAEELPRKANLSFSPPLFQSSSSATSSQDLTPSDLVPPHSDQQGPYPQALTHLQTAPHACDQEKPEGELSSGSHGATSTSQIELQPQPSSFRENLLHTLMLPVVQLVDVASVRGIHTNFQPHQAPPKQVTMSSYTQTTSRALLRTPPQCHSSEGTAIIQGMIKHFIVNQQARTVSVNPLNTSHPMQSAPVAQDASTSSSCQAPTRQSFSTRSMKLRQTHATTIQSQHLDRVSPNPLTEVFKATFQTSCPPLQDYLNVSGPPTQDIYTSTSQSEALSSVCTANQIISSTDSRQHPQTFVISPFQSKTLPCAVTSPTPNSRCMSVRSETSRVLRTQMRLSESSQAVLLQSKMLQPYVSLTRLSAIGCCHVTKERCSSRSGELVVQGGNYDNGKDRRMEEEEDADLSFDPNILYSSYSSSTDVEDSLDCDPDYKPPIKKKRLILEYESGRSQIHV